MSWWKFRGFWGILQRSRDINVLKPLEKAKFIYTVSAGDSKASAGMAQVGKMLKTVNLFLRPSGSARQWRAGKHGRRVRRIFDTSARLGSCLLPCRRRVRSNSPTSIAR